MLKSMIMAVAVAGFALSATPVVVQSDAVAQSKKKANKAKKPKVGKDQKMCRYKFPDGERRSWVCHKAVPCCAWDAIKYTKCGTTITGCL